MRNLKQTSQTWLAAIAALGLASGAAKAQTVIPGPTIPTSTWSPSGNPYIIAGDCTLASGDTLTILPGTVIWIGQGLSLTCNGRVQAVGTPTQRIKFQSPISSQTWRTIVTTSTAGTNEFQYCDFVNSSANALDCYGASHNEVISCTFSNCIVGLVFRDSSVNTAKFCDFQNVSYGIYMTVIGINLIQTSTITNCTFRNCAEEAVYGEAQGAACAGGCSSRLRLSVSNCVFDGVHDGCKLNIFGAYYIANPFQHCASYGYADAQIACNIFRNVTNTACRLTIGSYAGGGSATVLNNVIANAGSAIVLQDPWDAQIQTASSRVVQTP